MNAGLLKDIAEAEAKVSKATKALVYWANNMKVTAVLLGEPDKAVDMIDELNVRKYEMLAAHSKLLQLRATERQLRAQAHSGAAVAAAGDDSFSPEGKADD